MDVIIDGQRGFEFNDDPSDVLTAVAEITEALRQKGRAVLGVKVDGRTIAPDSIVPTLKDQSLQEAGCLEVSSEDTLTLVNDALNEIQEVLPDLPEACHRLAEVFQGEAPEEGYAPFYQLAEIWRTLKLREGQVADALDLDLDTLEITGEVVGRLHETLNRHLDEAAEALKRNDCVLLGDLLEYELAPKAEKEADIVAALRSQAKRQFGQT